MKVTAAFILVAFLVLPVAAWSQDAPIKVNFAPLLSTLSGKKWLGLRYDGSLVDAVRVALSQPPFQAASGPAADVLTLASPDGVKYDNKQYMFTVVFLRGGVKLGEAVQSCPSDKLGDCTDQLILDIKTRPNDNRSESLSVTNRDSWPTKSPFW